MKIYQNDIKLFAKAAIDTFNLEKISILNIEKALVFLESEISEEFSELNSTEVKNARHAYFKVPGTNPEDYSEKILDLGLDKKVIYGIRHKGGNVELPFVQIFANFEINSKRQSLEILKRVEGEFKYFEPLYLCFWSKKQIDADFYGSVYMVSSSEKIKKTNSWGFESGISFIKIQDDSFYDWYEKGYKEFHDSNPKLKTKVTVNSIDSMRDILNEGLLYYVELGGKRIGLIAAERSDFLGHSGLYFHEILITKEYKGKGLAKAVQRKFVSDFSIENEFIWGTIDSLNLPSYKTAKSNGRKPVRFECFVDL